MKQGAATGHRSRPPLFAELHQSTTRSAVSLIGLARLKRLGEVAIEAGWHLSFSGIVTFKKWDGNDMIRAVPEDRILVESDSPYLAPVPHRGKRNEPAYVSLTLAKVAEARGVSPATLGATVVANARRLFGLR